MPDSLVDSGVYHYQLNGEPTEIQEHWQRQRLASGEWLISSRRRAPGVEIEVNARMAAGRTSRFDVVWQDREQPLLRADYRLLDDRVVVNRTPAEHAAQSEEILFPAAHAAPLLFPLMRIFTGPLITRLLDQAGSGLVILPFISDPAATSRLLQPTMSERTARIIEAGAELDLCDTRFTCCRCEYLGDQYGPGSEFWVAQDETLVRYQWQQSPQQVWDVWLQRDP